MSVPVGRRPVKLGIAGVGMGGAAILPLLAAMPEYELVAGADVNPLMLERLAARYPGTRTYDTVAALCLDPEVEAVWVSSPNRFHCEHALEALRAGKHVAVEKPMAVSLAEADRMVDAAAAAGVKLIAAHTTSFGISLRAMRKIITSGELGSVQAIQILAYTDWMLRARTAEELVSTDEGGGIVHRQATHQIDTARLLGGGMLRSIRGFTREWMPERPIQGYFNALLEFEDGAVASILHNGHGYFMLSEMFPWAGAYWRFNDDDRLAMRDAIRGGARDEEREKEAFRIGGARDPVTNRKAPEPGPQPWVPGDLGMVIVTCERGDIRDAKYGLSVYGDRGRREIDLSRHPNWGDQMQAALVQPTLEEFYAAIVHGRPVYHSGEWGRATLEAVLALIDSSRERREVVLHRQVSMPPEYDSDLDLGEMTSLTAAQSP